MSVLVEHKENATPCNGSTNRATPSNKRSARDGQKVNKVKSSTDSASLGDGGGAKKMNMIAVQRVDSGLCDLLSTVPQVVLYQYEANSNTWERTSIEGTLFIYSRTSSPRHGFVLLNRLSSDNLHELIHPGSDYRVQAQFVLFKKQSDADKVYGLCFSSSLLSESTGFLLTRLSSQAGSNGTRREAGRTTAPMTVGMRSQSVPSFPQSQVGFVGEKVDILELLESAGNSYLNQTFSDETGSSSQDSPPSEGISFIATHPLTSSLPNDGSHPINVDTTPSSSSSSSAHRQRGAGDKSVKRSTPRTIPKLVNMSTTPPSTSFTHPPLSSSSSSHPPSHLVQSEVQYSSRVARSASKPTPTTSRQSSTETPPNTQQVTTSRGRESTTSTRSPLRSSTAPGHVGRGRKLNVPPPTRGTGGSSSRSSSLLQEVIPEQEQQQPLARQLFEPPPPTTTTTTTREGRATAPSKTATSTTADSSKTASHLETLFSQSLPASLASATPHKTPPTQPVMSLAEVEKQMTDEALRSPPRVPRSFAMFPLPPYLANLAAASSQSSQQSSSSSQPPAQNSSVVCTTTTSPSSSGTPSLSSSSSAAVNTTSTTAARDEQHFLLQPSSFSAATPPFRVKTTPIVTHTTTAGRTSSTTSHSPAVTTSTTPVAPVVHRSNTTPSVQLNIEPPSPVVTTSHALQPRRGPLLTNGVFPDIPPLMHSPGMRAPPVSHDSGANSENGSNQRGVKGKKGTGRRGRRSPGKSGSPVGGGESPSPQPEVTSSGGAPLPVMGETPPSRSWSVPGNMNPEVSVAVPSQPATQPHTLLSPQQFSLSETPPPSLSHTPPPGPDPHGQPLSKDQFKQALLFLIQNDEEFVSRIHHAYHLSVSGHPQ